MDDIKNKLDSKFKPKGLEKGAKILPFPKKKFNIGGLASLMI